MKTPDTEIAPLQRMVKDEANLLDNGNTSVFPHQKEMGFLHFFKEYKVDLDLSEK